MELRRVINRIGVFFLQRLLVDDRYLGTREPLEMALMIKVSTFSDRSSSHCLTAAIDVAGCNSRTGQTLSGKELVSTLRMGAT